MDRQRTGQTAIDATADACDAKRGDVNGRNRSSMWHYAGKHQDNDMQCKEKNDGTVGHREE